MAYRLDLKKRDYRGRLFKGRVCPECGGTSFVVYLGRKVFCDVCGGDGTIYVDRRSGQIYSDIDMREAKAGAAGMRREVIDDIARFYRRSPMRPPPRKPRPTVRYNEDHTIDFVSTVYDGLLPARVGTELARRFGPIGLHNPETHEIVETLPNFHLPIGPAQLVQVKLRRKRELFIMRMDMGVLNEWPSF